MSAEDDPRARAARGDLSWLCSEELLALLARNAAAQPSLFRAPAHGDAARRVAALSARLQARLATHERRPPTQQSTGASTAADGSCGHAAPVSQRRRRATAQPAHAATASCAPDMRLAVNKAYADAARRRARCFVPRPQLAHYQPWDAGAGASEQSAAAAEPRADVETAEARSLGTPESSIAQDDADDASGRLTPQSLTPSESSAEEAAWAVAAASAGSSQALSEPASSPVPATDEQESSSEHYEAATAAACTQTSPCESSFGTQTSGACSESESCATKDATEDGARSEASSASTPSSAHIALPAAADNIPRRAAFGSAVAVPCARVAEEARTVLLQRLRLQRAHFCAPPLAAAPAVPVAVAAAVQPAVAAAAAVAAAGAVLQPPERVDTERQPPDVAP